MTFRLGKHGGEGGPVATPPKEKPTFAELLVIAGESRLTIDEAKILAWRFIQQSRKWQEKGNDRDRRLYRQETREEAQEIKEIGG